MQLFTNNAVGSLASGVNATDNTLVLVAGDGTKFPSITGGDFFLLTLTQSVGLETSWEIVKCTARSGDSLTVVRAQEGTTGQAWAAGSKVDLRVTAGTLETLKYGSITTMSVTYNGDDTIATLIEDGVTKTMTYNADGTINKISWPVTGGKTRTETYSYTSGTLTGMTATEV